MSVPNKQVVEKYLKVVRIAAEGSGNEANIAKDKVKDLIDRYPDLPFHAASYAAESMVKNKMEEAQRVAVAAGRKVAPSDFQGLLDGLLSRTGEIIGHQLSETMEKASQQLVTRLSDFSEDVMSYEPANVYERGNFADQLQRIAEELDPDDNCVEIGTFEDGEEYLRIELTLPAGLIDAINARAEHKQLFTEWLLSHDEDTMEITDEQ